jgi:hypothetical protein
MGHTMSDKVQGWVWDLDLPPTRKLVLLWLAGRATDNGLAFPGEREIRQRTGLCERMVRYHLQWLAADRDDDGQQKQPLLVRVERRLSSQRSASNVPDTPRRRARSLTTSTFSIWVAAGALSWFWRHAWCQVGRPLAWICGASRSIRKQRPGCAPER